MNDFRGEVFIAGRGKILVTPGEPLPLGRMIAIRSTRKETQRELENFPFATAGKQPGSIKVVPGIEILTYIKSHFPQLEVYPVGKLDVIVEVTDPIRQQAGRLFLLALVCLLLFVGSGLTIISFHDDVNMALTHQTLYTMLTGMETTRPLILQIPYSLGLGLGMMLFFNHLGKRSGKREPSPLEVEMHLYEKNIQQYLRDRQEKKGAVSSVGDG